jgi:glycerol dehydrogenase-like iron-containing ADH family enzyme
VSDAAESAPAAWLDMVTASGGRSPLLIVADNQAIATQSADWFEQFSMAGWLYRVRLGEVPAAFCEQEAAAIAVEAKSLQATAILAVGASALLEVAAEAAEQAQLPLIRREAG